MANNLNEDSQWEIVYMWDAYPVSWSSEICKIALIWDVIYSRIHRKRFFVSRISDLDFKTSISMRLIWDDLFPDLTSFKTWLIFSLPFPTFCLKTFLIYQIKMIMTENSKISFFQKFWLGIKTIPISISNKWVLFGYPEYIISIVVFRLLHFRFRVVVYTLIK